MTTCSARLVSFLVLLVVLASGISSVSTGSAIAADGTGRPSTVCLTDHALLCRVIRQGNYSPIRMAQMQHCRCCGKDENGHCNHQCCD
jgi:hypothetical protein